MIKSTDAAARRQASGFSILAGVVWTLVMSTVVFVAFLLVPLLVLALAFGVYWVWPGNRSRKSRSSAPTPGDAPEGQGDAELPAYRFGTGS